VRVALLIDSAADAPYHRATVTAIGQAADALGLQVNVSVHATDSVTFDDRLSGVDGVVIGPGSPYRDDASVWSVIRTARECGVPLVGT
jgi:CTP synthase (UTP-ammonia lyase)